MAQFRAQVLDGSLVPTLVEQHRHRLARSPGPAEIRSWERSLHTLSADLVQAGLDDVEVLVEYQLPLTSKRADVVLCGVHPITRQPSYVVVELKQWSSVTLLEDSVDLCVVHAYGGARLHPGEQVRRYCGHLGDFLATLADLDDSLAGVAYLHNATDRDVEELFRLPEDEQGRLFTGQRRSEFLDYLKGRLAPVSGVEAADQLLGSAVRPSRQLLALAAEEVQRREMFRLQDQQQTAYRLVLRALERARRGVTKQAIVVVGGPGSGKSVIALSLLGELSRQGRTVLHATGSSAFTQTLRKVAGQRAPRVKAMFRYFNQFGELEPNELDVLLCDEAHRIREMSANRYTKASARTGAPQVDELLQVARVPVFLLDEHQVVRPGELGSLREIKAAAARLGIDVECVELDGQYRCGGSRAYERWVLRLLGLEPGGPMAWGAMSTRGEAEGRVQAVGLIRPLSRRAGDLLCEAHDVRDKEQLRQWVLEAVDAVGPSGVVAICRYLWDRHEQDLRSSGDLFYTWQYDVRWAAQSLRDEGVLAPVGRGKSAVWRRA